MIASRISVAILGFALTAFGAVGQTDDSHATAPPRQLGIPGTEQAPEASSDGLKDDGPEPGPVQESATSQSNDGASDVSTEDLLDDNEDAPAKASPKGSKAPAVVVVTPAGPILPKPGKIEVTTLGAVDAGTAGLLDPGNGGLESTIWSGSSRADVEQLLAKTPLSSPDSAVRSLARRVVLSRADAPPGPFKRSLVTIRVEKLLGGGMIDDAGALAAAADAKDDADLARVQANALLLSGRTKEVCGDKTASRLSEGDLFWLQLRAYCAAASGDTATADITRSVIDAQGQTDAAYNILVEDALTGAKRVPGKIAKPTAIHLFLLRKAGLPIGPDIFARVGGAAVVAMRDTHNSPELRLAAAEYILKSGAVSAADLRAVVDAQVVPADQIANVLTVAPKLSFVKAQALLRRAAQLESRPAEKAALIHQALVLGDKAGLFETAASLQADVAVSIKAEGLAPNEGPLIGWALLIAGKSAAAGPWLGNNDVARAVLGLATAKDDTAQAALSSIATRMTTATDKTQSATRPMEALLLGSYDALEHTLPADAKAEASAIRAQHLPGRRPDDAVMQKMLLAAAAPDRKGEAILRILDIVGPKGPGDLAPDITVEIVRALQGMGLKDSARAIALHALLLYRPGTS